MVEYDILIKDATIVEGTGKKAYKGTIGVTGDKVASIGARAQARNHKQVKKTTKQPQPSHRNYNARTLIPTHRRAREPLS